MSRLKISGMRHDVTSWESVWRCGWVSQRHSASSPPAGLVGVIIPVPGTPDTLMHWLYRRQPQEPDQTLKGCYCREGSVQLRRDAGCHLEDPRGEEVRWQLAESGGSFPWVPGPGQWHQQLSKPSPSAKHRCSYHWQDGERTISLYKSTVEC